jgi:hypothetical protein
MARIKATLDDLKLEAWLRNREKERIVWTTKAGFDIAINKMTDTHLANTIAMLERQEEEASRRIEEEWEYLEALGSIGDADI